MDNYLSYYGAIKENRTLDLLFTRETLYQLSYNGICYNNITNYRHNAKNIVKIR